jgi:hypothetical protein
MRPTSWSSSSTSLGAPHACYSPQSTVLACGFVWRQLIASPPLTSSTNPSLPSHRARSTAGRTFHTCLLRLGTPPAARCPKSYDRLTPADTLSNCTLLSSHDDFSAVQSLPAGRVAVVTQLRDPLERFLSAYEFAIEVGLLAAGFRSLHLTKHACTVFLSLNHPTNQACKHLKTAEYLGRDPQGDAAAQGPLCAALRRRRKDG